MILTPTSERNLNNLKVALKSSRAVLIQGEIGCGKSFLANTLAESFGAKDTMIQVNVDDSFDSKDLLGKFSATDTPGAFEWIPGPLTSAVENGYWFLTEDINLASFDVFSVLLSLLEESTLFLPEKNRRIEAHPNFKIIATQQLRAVGDTFTTRKSNSIPFAELWGTVVMESLPPDEICTVATTLYSVPRSIVYNLATLLSTRTGAPLVTLRSLLKWCRRVNKRATLGDSPDGFISSTVRELMFREAFDCILAGYPTGNDLISSMILLADAIGVSPNVGETLVKESRPDMNLGRDYFTVGRVTMPLYNSLIHMRESRVAFAATKHAMSLLERIAVAVDAGENVLLTGETGVGKTFIVQFLADQIGQNLIVHNLNQQTDTSDFMGGWKPLDVSVTVRAAYHKFVELFSQTFNASKNVQFLDALQAAIRKCSWLAVVKQILKGYNTFKLKNSRQPFTEEIVNEWLSLEKTSLELLDTLEKTKTTFAFKFEEGSLAKAWREGSWILLDELNLATTEVLERVSSVLGDVDNLFLTDKGSCEPIKRHRNFNVFANMNPPTDVGKKELPPSLRSKFTELYVNEPFDRNDINIVVTEYIGHLAADCKSEEITTFFLECVGNAKSSLCSLDGETKPPSFSLRTLTRALTYVRKATSQYGFALALFDGLMLGFATSLQRQFHAVVEQLIIKNIFGGKQPPKPTLPRCPSEGNYVAYEHIWLPIGSKEPQQDDSFILTPSVRGHLLNVARAVFADRPVLLEGPTSSGKSSMVKYLAEMTGHKFVRINNHESTEIQEYVGHYVSDERGKLRFVDGILVDAVRNGYWVVLDELNLAPTDVLEALNRLLDDNRELFIADTQETVKPHPHLRIFATQNPAGIYGGRKLLSRAFRNRFLEITVDDIPTTELCTILCQRYSLNTSFAEKMVEIMISLQLRRQASQVFAGRHGFITPRDLFRWAERCPETYQEMAEHGFLLLAERCRKVEERQIVKDVIESVTKTELNEDAVYSPEHWPYVEEFYKLLESGIVDEFGIVWTESMRRLFTVVGICLHHKEPVLLVGETGSSKTTVCQLWAALLKRRLSIINCHQHSESSDFLGSLRPAPPDQRNKAIFEWRNGPLVESMIIGGMFVLDEISLAEDSVLERLNSVLEPSRVITLAEKSTADVIFAHEDFRILATMNPGGDFGKKELSPALRNRFTEIYVRPTTNKEEVTLILSKRLIPCLEPWAERMATLLCDTAEATRVSGTPQHISIRDIIGWVSFMNAANNHCEDGIAFLHGLDAVILDGIGVGTGQMDFGERKLRDICLENAKKLCGLDDSCLEIPFWELFDGIEEPKLPPAMERRFFFGAPSTRKNLSKLIRASIMRKAILLEGSPGVGKTSIVEALGSAFGKRVVRINLSEQTDIMDLFGTYLPCPSSDESEGTQFSWSDGVLLQALKIGWWVILDELNLASQAVLEGLNALLDHRSAVFIPELGEEFHAAEDFRVFACQNPLMEGGGRKGLPRSFLNRFTKVRIEPFEVEDLMSIALAVSPNIDETVLTQMVHFVGELNRDIMVRRVYGTRGSPWEFNLRDVLRWAKMMESYHIRDKPCEFIESLFVQRMRTDIDRERVRLLVKRYFGDALNEVRSKEESDFIISDNAIFFGGSFLTHRTQEPVSLTNAISPLILPSQAAVIRSILTCTELNQFCLLVGPSGSGKTYCLRTAAALAGARLVTFSMNASCDTVDLLGGFDQVEGKQGQFEWRDSLILEAMQSGDWLVLDNVNYCNASVLDRLNPLVEPNGMLSVNEQGLVDGHVRLVWPHPNFRLFATLDPKYGEISRAMRNRAVELYLPPVSIPSLESIALAGASSSCRIIEVHDKLTRYHREFVLTGFHADSNLPLSPQLLDALAAGAPNMFTLLKTAAMLPPDATLEDLKSALLHKYIQNRSGHWSTKKAEILEALERIVMKEEVNERQSCFPPIMDLLSAMSLQKEVQEEEEDESMEAALIRIRVQRSGLALKTLLSKKDGSVFKYSPRDLSLFFLLEQCSDNISSEMLKSTRNQFISNSLSTILSENEISETLLLLSSDYNCNSSEYLETLWCRSQYVLGPHSTWIQMLRSARILISDSPILNTSFQRMLSTLLEVIEDVVSPQLQQRVWRYLNPLLLLLFPDLSSSFQVSANNFVPLVTNVALLRSVAKKQNIFDCSTLVNTMDEFLASLRRYLDLPYQLVSEKSAIQQSIIRPHITTVDERSTLAAWNKAANAVKLEKQEKLLKSMWDTAIFRAEFNLIQHLHYVSKGVSGFSTSNLQSEISQFIDLYCTKLRVLPDIEIALWKEVLSLRLQDDGDHKALIALVPLLKTHFMTRHGLNSGRHCLHGSWAGATYDALGYAAEVSVISIGSKKSPHTEIMTGLLNFYRVLPVRGMNPFEQWELNGMEDLFALLKICVPHLFKNMEEKNTLTKHVPTSILQVMNLVREVLNSSCTDSVITSIRPLLEIFISNDGCTPNDSLLRVALVEALRCRLLLPTSPIDPMYKWSVKKTIAQEELERFSRLEEAFKWSEELAMRTGSKQRSLVCEIQRIEKMMLVTASKKSVVRPDLTGARFAQMVSLLHQICSTMMSDDRLAVVLTEGRPEVSAERGTWSELLFQQLHEVLESFGGYEDVTLTVAEPALFASLAAHVSCLLNTPVHKGNVLFGRTEITRMMQFPLLCVSSPTLPSPGTQALQHRLTYLDSCLMLIQSTPAQVLNRDFVENLFYLYRDFHRTVEELEAKERREQEMAVLYAEKAITIEGDDEKHLRMLKMLFPSYEEEFIRMRDAEEESNGISNVTSTATNSHPSLLKSSSLDRAGRHARIMLSGPQGARYLRRLLDTHYQFFEKLLSQEDISVFDGEKALQAFKSRFDVLSSELRRVGCNGMSENGMMLTAGDEQLLLGGFAARTVLLMKELESTEVSLEEKRMSGFNIFTDPVPSELRSFSVALQVLINAVEELRAAYPDTPSLHRCSRIAAGIAAMPALTTPLMKIMTGCEILLRECYEWERNASRDTSILKHMTDLSSFVLRWRRLELHCWSQVFRAKREEWELKASMHWFVLFDLIDAGRPIPEDEPQERSLEFFRHCMEFMWASHYGDFHVRLRLLKAFALHLVASAPSSFSPLANVAMHLSDFFSQFSQLVSDKLQHALGPLEEDMEAFARIMRWEDSTYYAVRATAEKSHLKMGRGLAELDDILRTPVLGIISGEEQRCEDDMAMGFILPSVQLDKNKNRTNKQKKSKNHGNNDSSNSSAGSKRKRSGKPIKTEGPPVEEDNDDVDDDTSKTNDSITQGMEFLRYASEEIVERVKELRSPGTTQSQKSRALKTLFNVMEEKGVPHTHVEQVSSWEELFTSTNALLACRSKYGHLTISHQVGEAALEHYRSARWLQRMRDAERHPHKDLSGAQAKRGTGTVESLFALAVEETELVSNLYEVRHQVLLLRDCVASCEEYVVPGGGKLLQSSLDICVQLQCFLHDTRWILQERVFELESARGHLEELCCTTDELWKLCLISDTQRRTNVPVADSLIDQHIALLERLRELCTRLGNTDVGCVSAAASALCTSLSEILTQNPVLERRENEMKRVRVENESDWLQNLQETLNDLDTVFLKNNMNNCNNGHGSPYSVSSFVTAERGEEKGAEVGVYHNYAVAMRELCKDSHRLMSSMQTLLHDQRKEREMASTIRHELLKRLETSILRMDALMEKSTMALQAQSHLGLVLARLLSILLKKGFCKPEDADDEDDDNGDGDGDGEQQEGTGMDDGHGEKDVTDQIENEDQLMNMKDKEEHEQEEKKEDENDGSEGEDNAADVETDFKGEKQQREESQEKSDDDSNDGDESEKEMGSVDGDEAQERKRTKKDKNDGNDMESDDGDNAEDVPEDTLANETEKDDALDENDDEETGNFENREAALRDAEREQQEGEHDLAADTDGIEDGDADDEQEGSSMNDEDAESQADSNNTEEKDEREKDDDDDDDDKNSRTSKDREDEDGATDASKDPHDAEEEDAIEDDPNNNNNNNYDHDNEDDNDDDDDASYSGDDTLPDENIHHGGRQDENAGEEATEQQEQNAEDAKRREAEQQKQQDAAGTEEQQPGDEQKPDDAGRNWKRQEKNEASQRRDNTERNASSRNPYRAIKEALQRHERRAQQLNLNQHVDVKKQKMTQEEQQKQQRQQQNNNEEQETIEEFEFDGEGEREGMAATDEKPVPVTEAESNLPDMEENNDTNDDSEEDEEAPEDTSMRRRKKQADTKLEMHSDEENDDYKNMKEKKGKQRVKVNSKKSREDEENEDDDEYQEESAVDGEDEKMNRGRKLWQEQVSAVQGLSHHLCEQLRLILAPTLADKLQGDYKTGKRLNMKRIIPYIASQFKKDRIWLRRTKPNKRNYQILVALDDSFSMHCNNAGVMSCRAVALLAEALRQLEVGELGIACFGKETRIVHGMDEPFTGESGPQAFSEVTFAQKSTSLKLLLQTSLDYLDNARERIRGQTRSTTEQLQQMMFIISDGQITEDRAELRKLLMRAEGNRQIVVFVLLDVKATSPSNPNEATSINSTVSTAEIKGGSETVSAPLTAKDLAGLTPAERMRRLKAEREARLHRVQSNSVLDMQLVEFRGGRVVRRSYMEEFPFPYYLIVRELETLPGAIADAMRQWFELLNVQH
ncbi:Midasin AAA lid domain 5 [Trypanosoma melophagium]|uniref:Midasin AAA lid domain 5 n=1 Tax=Trypanosoma melophagium TaxID=715481 RepID=UPI00351A41C8|nr:Midasin AAA lid domain 5 [Trypanosoma melophagium]